MQEFQDYYGDARAKSQWQAASHFDTLWDFCVWFNLGLVRPYEHGLVRDELTQSYAALFGLWLPCFVLLLDVNHLEGKLRVPGWRRPAGIPAFGKTPGTLDPLTIQCLWWIYRPSSLPAATR